MRPWLLLKHARIKFSEVSIPLYTSKGVELLEELCPAKMVPVLYDGPLTLWDSLAICEYIADKAPEKKLWPEDSADRARARAMSAEMHSSFLSLRNEMPMNCRRLVQHFTPSTDAQIDINRIVQLWEQALSDSGGPWLFGHFTVTDAMYAPVVSRFRTYGIKVPELSAEYMNTVLAHKAVKQWLTDAEHETDIIEHAEIEL